MIAAVILVAWCGAVAMQATQQPPRDTRPRTAETGTASISGTVVSDEAQPRKLRRARVALNSAVFETGGRTVITDDEGRYRFSGLPAGQYSLIAVKDGYISARYGSVRPPRIFNPLRTATGLSLRSGEGVTADFRLARGAVITGVVTDAEGRPEEGVTVGANAYQFIPGAPERRLVPGSPDVRTDDRGVYRIYGLRAGEYIVCGRRSEPALKLSSTDSRGLVAAPICFPSATDPAAATAIRVAAGDERAGVDIQMRYVPIATVSGIVPLPAGSMVGRVTLARWSGQPGVFDSMTATTTQPDGTFSFPNIAPGHYTLFGFAQGPSAPGGASNPSAAGTIDVVVDGDDVTGIAIPLSTPFSLAGRLVFDGAASPDVRLGRMTVPITPIDAYLGPGLAPSFQPVDDSHFTVSGLIAGVYRIPSSTAPGIRTPIGKWWLKSITIAGRELLDGPLDIRPSNDEVTVTVGDQASAVSGTVSDGQGAPLADTYVVIFGADRASWYFNSRRVAAVRTDGQGRYTIRNLPPGGYHAAVALDLAQDEWFDPDALQTLLPTAVTLTIAGTESKAIDLTVR